MARRPRPIQVSPKYCCREWYAGRATSANDQDIAPWTQLGRRDPGRRLVRRSCLGAVCTHLTNKCVPLLWSITATVIGSGSARCYLLRVAPSVSPCRPRNSRKHASPAIQGNGVHFVEASRSKTRSDIVVKIRCSSALRHPISTLALARAKSEAFRASRPVAGRT